MSDLSQLIDRQLKPFMDQMSAVKKTVDTLSKSRIDQQDIVKALTGAPGDGSRSKSVVYHPEGSLGHVFHEVHDKHNRKQLFGAELLTALYMDGCEGLHKNRELQQQGSNYLREKGFKRGEAVRNPIMKAAMAEGAGATGGYTVPPQYTTEIQRQIGEENELYKRCRIIPMQSRDIYIPVLDQTATPVAGQSAFYGGMKWSWVPEAGNYQTQAESEPSFRQAHLTARDLVGISLASNQLLQDNPMAVDTILTTLIKEGINWTREYFIINGNGAGQPLGFLNASTMYLTQTKTVSGHFSFADAAGMVSKMVPWDHDNMVWMMHPGNIPDVYTMTNGATNAPTLVWLNPYGNGDEGPAARAVPSVFFGKPIIWTEKLPAPGAGVTGSVCLVDPSRLLVGDRMEIQIEASPWPAFTTYQMMWRVIIRWDAQPEFSKPFTLADGVYQVSPVVLLAM